jgi:hypothetical protein
MDDIEITKLALRILAEELSAYLDMCPPPRQGERGWWLPGAGDERCSACEKGQNCRWQCLADWAIDEARARLKLPRIGELVNPG